MNKILWLVGAVLLLVMAGGMYKFNYLASQPGYDVDGNKIDTSVTISSPKNATYIIDGESVTLVDGMSEKAATPGSATKVTTRYFGNELKIDLDGDGRKDTVFLLTQNRGGSGTFFYAAAALNTAEGFVGSQAILVGDRIAPQSTDLSTNPNHQNVIVVNYADRSVGQPMSEPPTVGKSLWLKFDLGSMSFGTVEQDFPGEANPDLMTLTMQPWTWIKTTYNNDTELVPSKVGEFTLTFKDDGTLSVATDCNAMGGTYQLDKNNITYGPMAATEMFCPDSQEQAFAGMLAETQSFFFTNKGELVFDLKFDSGSAIFR